MAPRGVPLFRSIRINIAQRTKDALLEQGEAGARDLDAARRSLKEAKGAIVKSSPGIAQLLAEYDEARQRVAPLATALGYLATQGMLPPEADRWYAKPDRVPDFSVQSTWKRALEDRETDPDAGLPEAVNG